MLIELDLGYAITVHKAQGSEFPVVLFILSRTQHYMLDRSLVYTGVARGKKLTILLGQKSALRDALFEDRSAHRQSLLCERMQHEL